MFFHGPIANIKYAVISKIGASAGANKVFAIVGGAVFTDRFAESHHRPKCEWDFYIGVDYGLSTLFC
jgi:hypothetical protein